MKMLPPKFVIETYFKEHSQFVQEILFSLGYVWADTNGDIFREEAFNGYENQRPCIFCSSDKKLSYSPHDFYIRHKEDYGPLITTDDLLRCASPKVSVQLNSKYTAEVSKQGIKVGCQTFPLEIIDHLMEAKNKILE